ncbi:MAG: hypothetical protein R2712_04640 [Vicinamibacterales bacterium]
MLIAAAAGACTETPTSATEVSDDGTPTLTTFASLLTAHGASTRSIIAGSAGLVEATLTATDPADAIVGLGLGIPRPDGRGCNLTSALTTTAAAGRVLALPVEPGDYCVQVYDTGQVTTQVGFSVTLSYP